MGRRDCVTSFFQQGMSQAEAVAGYRINRSDSVKLLALSRPSGHGFQHRPFRLFFDIGSTPIPEERGADPSIVGFLPGEREPANANDTRGRNPRKSDRAKPSTLP